MKRSVEIDFEVASREIIVLIRGRFSQERVSRALGFQFNQVHKWESGRKKIGWSDFAKLCEFRRKPLSTAIAKAVGFGVDPVSARDILKALMGATKPELAARKLGISVPTLRRWLRGQGEPTLAGMLTYLHVSRTRLLTFCEHLGLSEIPPSLKPYHDASQRELESARLAPWTPALLALLETEDYAFLSLDTLGSRLAQKLGLPREKVAKTIKRLVNSGVIGRSGSGSWKVATDSVQVADSIETAKILLNFWLRHAAQFTVKNYPSPKSLAAFCHFAVSRENAAKIRLRVQQFWSELGPLINADQSREEMFSLALGLVHVDDFELRDLS